MKIELKQITVREVVDGYEDNDEQGVKGYHGLLNIRPKYQREFVYKERQRDAVINTVMNVFPLNVMYWAVCDDGTYEIIDGQQRTVSLCRYVAGDFSFDMRYFHTLQSDEKARILDYPLMIYLCEGTDSEKLKWFETINIAGEKLTAQELRNAVYAGEWLTDAKRYFSRNGCPAMAIGRDYMSGSAIRQDYLETALRWISDGNIEIYMSKNQHKPNANELWLYFQAVVAWVKALFPKRRKEMQAVEWGELYNRYSRGDYDAVELEKQVARLMRDSDVTKKSGIYPYLLTGKEKYLSIRTFDDNMKREAYERQNGICPICKEHFEIEQMEADHITPWCEGGPTIADNCQMLCRDCNRHKSSR